MLKNLEIRRRPQISKETESIIVSGADFQKRHTESDRAKIKFGSLGRDDNE